jgi:hypothetical protein
MGDTGENTWHTTVTRWVVVTDGSEELVFVYQRSTRITLTDSRESVWLELNGGVHAQSVVELGFEVVVVLQHSILVVRKEPHVGITQKLEIAGFQKLVGGAFASVRGSGAENVEKVASSQLVVLFHIGHFNDVGVVLGWLDIDQSDIATLADISSKPVGVHSNSFSWN